MRKHWYTIGVFLLGCLLGYYFHYSQVNGRIVIAGDLSFVGEMEGWLQTSPWDDSVTGVQLHNGSGNHIVVASVIDAEGKTAEFTQIHMAKPVGRVYPRENLRGYLSAGRAVPLHNDAISNRTYAVLLPGDNAILKFEGGATVPIQVQYYSVGDERPIFLTRETLKLE